jgi:hypothetical protein
MGRGVLRQTGRSAGVGAAVRRHSGCDMSHSTWRLPFTGGRRARGAEVQRVLPNRERFKHLGKQDTMTLTSTVTFRP